MPGTAPVLAAGVGFRHGWTWVLRAASFRVEPALGGHPAIGIAIAGHGARSAVVDLLAGLTRPAYGELRVLGQDLTTARGRSMVRGHVGVARGSSLPQPGLKVRGAVRRAARRARLPAGDQDVLTAAILDRLALTPWADVPMRSAPVAVVRRAWLAAAAVHEPGLLLLDGLLDNLCPRDAASLTDGIHDLGRDTAIIATGWDAATLGLACGEVLTLADGILIGELAARRCPAASKRLLNHRCPRLRKMNWSLLGCGFGGHVTYAPDEPALRSRLSAATAAGQTWRCLRCGSFVPGVPDASGPAAAAPHVRRGKELRSAFILRFFAVERFVRAVIFGAGAYFLWRFKSSRLGIEQAFDRELPLVRSALRSLGYNVDHSKLVGLIRHAFTLNQTTLTWLAIAAVGYALIEIIEGTGLWLLKRWGEYFAMIATSAGIPYEIYDLTAKVTVLRIVAFTINIALVVYLVYSKRLLGARGGKAAYEARLRSASIIDGEIAALAAEDAGPAKRAEPPGEAAVPGSGATPAGAGGPGVGGPGAERSANAPGEPTPGEPARRGP